ncbi:MAG TPA: hypothetical protein PLX04_03785 [Caldisericia bacterium]|nr:hypothetical protein [Caldisericia bacterium]HPL89354.1 hypothetical protein [Caldisericia bacterium]HQG60040.1 hypothetical protein [Caldisericia bacterium]HQH49513.1 hypothetical protein [Caldisericia bacterium]HQJ44780.1 hypothetical protein [Caldisericia bacterium]
MKKSIITAILVFCFFLASCGGNKTNQPEESSDNPQVDIPATAEKPVDRPKNIELPKIKIGLVGPMKQSQLMTSMALIPGIAAQVPVGYTKTLLYNNIGLSKKTYGKNFQTKLSFLTPYFLTSHVEQPEYPLEDYNNWYWSVQDQAQTVWFAGNFSLDQKLLPAIRNDNYQKTRLGKYGLSVYTAPKNILSPRYSKIIVPMAKDFGVFLDHEESLVDADQTALDIFGKTGGLMAGQNNSSFFSFCGDPESMVLAIPNVRASEAKTTYQYLQNGNNSKVLETIKGFERPAGMGMVAVNFINNEPYNLRFVIQYENENQAREDMPYLAYIWNSSEIQKAQLWRQDLEIKETRFSNTLNCGIIECKISSKLPYEVLMSFIASAFSSGQMVQFLKK